jgi:predicted LPLAT superfamily acyltransferase
MFAQVVIDRFAMYAGRHFRVTIDGFEHFRRLAERPGAFVLLSSHVGNYEMAGYTLVSDHKRLNALVFSGEKQTVMEHRTEMFADKNIRMIPVSDDMSHLFLLNQAIQQGEIVSMPADRIFGSQKSVSATLLGAPVRLPLGPFSVAAMHGLRVLAVNVMKVTPDRYHVYVRPISYDHRAPRQEQTRQLAQRYAAELERILTIYPTQWYNYFEYWNVL